MEQRTYPTRVDWWLAAIVIGATVACFIAGIGALSENQTAGLVVLGCGVFMVAVVLLLTWPMSYTLTDDGMEIRSGVTKNRIPYVDIDAAHLTANPLASAAWSLQRLHIDYRKNGKRRFILISPPDRRRFMIDLAERDPGLRFENDRLSRLP